MFSLGTDYDNTECVQFKNNMLYASIESPGVKFNLCIRLHHPV